ncbi:MAG: hypothetical protein KDC98_23650 [Planctomycetes bacterium]|nr:hypothetical protein [Planctomycetota bacterium]
MNRLLPVLLAVPLAAQETIEQRLDRLELENRELHRLVEEIAATPRGSDEQSPGIAKAYHTDAGLSIAGYGEYLFTQRSGRTDVADALRTVLYLGYHFDEKWLLHSEIEVEHGSTSSSSGTASGGGEVSLEFGHLEYQATEELAFRVGMVLVPLGLVNAEHEPTRFLTVSRSQTESRIIPTTWRELGIEGIGRFGGLELEAFVGSGLDGEEFDASGLRGGRQKGNRAAIDDIAMALRVDYRCCPELRFGGAAFYQRAGQDGVRTGSPPTPIPELDTVIAEAHVEWTPGPWTVRAMWASAFSDDAHEFAVATGRNLAERSDGCYGEVGCDLAPWLWPESEIAVTPFLRFEEIDTQAAMPEGIAADASQKSRILTVGVNVKPDDRIVFKLDFEDWDNSYDRMNISMGYVF